MKMSGKSCLDCEKSGWTSPEKMYLYCVKKQWHPKKYDYCPSYVRSQFNEKLILNMSFILKLITRGLL